MQEGWISFLDQCFPVHKISRVIIYTDKLRFWLAKGLADAAKSFDWQISFSLLDDIIEDDILDILQSFSFLSETTLLAGIFGENKSIDLINQIFPPLYSPTGFPGFSIVSLQLFPDQFFSKFLLANYDEVIANYVKYKKILRKGNKIRVTTSNGTFVDYILKSDVAKFPMYIDTDEGNRHIIFPATEIIAEIDSLQGEIVIDYSIGEYIENEELVDPFGIVESPIKISINDGIITEISGNSHLTRRFNKQIEEMEPSSRVITKIGIGIGPINQASGFIKVDKQFGKTCNFGLSDRKIEFIIHNPLIELI